MSAFSNFSLSIIGLFFIFYTLSTASSFFIPLVISLALTFFIFTLAETIKQIKIKNIKCNSFFAYLFALFILFSFCFFVFNIIWASASSMVAAAPEYQIKLQKLIERIESFTGIEGIFQRIELKNKPSIIEITSNIALMFKDIASNTFLIFLYVLFMLIEFQHIGDKISALFKEEKKKKIAYSIFEKSKSKVQHYLAIKSLISLATAFLSLLPMLFVGVDFAYFWAFLIFLLNFIPNIGSIVATLIPSLLTLLQFDTFSPFFIIFLSLLAIQFLTGNIIEPKIMSKSFNLSGLVIILSLTIWGSIWGIIGMFLCVPIMVITVVVFAQFPKTRPIAIILSKDGSFD